MNRGRPFRLVIGVVVLPLLAGGSSARADDAPATLAQLKDEHQQRKTALNQRRAQALSSGERRAIQAETWAEIKRTAAQAFRWADEHRSDPESLDAIIWTIRGLSTKYDREYDPEIRRAYTLLSERELDSDRIIAVCTGTDAAAIACPEARRFLEAAAERSPNRSIRGAACLGLARTEVLASQMAQRLRDPITARILIWNRIHELSALLQQIDPIETERKAVACYDRIVAEFADVKLPYSGGESLGELARRERDAFVQLSWGRVAPGLEGEAVQGGKIRLDDFRGKVVVVNFWAKWCVPCMGMIPGERELTERMKGRPFTFLGVNGDAERDKAVQTMRDERMTWPSLWNGGQRGAVVAAWAVRAWPTIYVIDAHGVIRYDDLRGEALDRAVEKLVAEAEAEARPAAEPPR